MGAPAEYGTTGPESNVSISYAMQCRMQRRIQRRMHISAATEGRHDLY